MGKSRNRKDHKKKVAARNNRISQQKRQIEKMQKQFLMDLIKREQEKGAFENTTPVDNPVIANPTLETPSIDIQGPQI